MEVFYKAREEVFRMDETPLRFRDARESTQDSFCKEKGVCTLLRPDEACKMTARTLADTQQSGQIDTSDESTSVCLKQRTVTLLPILRDNILISESGQYLSKSKRKLTTHSCEGKDNDI